MTFEELLQKYEQAEGSQRLEWLRDQAYEGMGALYDDFSNAAENVDAPLNAELRDWLDTLDMLCGNPPQTFESSIRQALLKSNNLSSFLFRPRDGVRNYDLIKSALMSRSEEAGASFDRHLKQINDYYGLQMNLDFIPDIPEPVFEPEQKPEPEPEQIQSEETAASQENYTYGEIREAYLQALEAGSLDNILADSLAETLELAGHIRIYDNGDRDLMPDPEEFQRRVQEYRDYPAFQSLIAEMDDEALKAAIRNPSPFFRALEDRGRELSQETTEPEAQESRETTEPEAQESRETTEPEAQESQETSETPETEEPEEYTTRRFLEELIGSVEANMESDLSPTNMLALITAAYLHVDAGRGDEPFDPDALKEEQQTLSDSDAFKQMIAGMDDEDIREASLNPEIFYSLLEEKRSEIQAAKEVQEEQEEQEKQEEQEEQEEQVEESAGETVPETAPETISETAPETTEETAPEYTYNVALSDLQQKPGRLPKDYRLASVLALHLHILQGDGETIVDMDGLVNEAIEIRDDPVFRTVMKEINDRQYASFIQNPYELDFAMTVFRDKLEREKQGTVEETTEPEKQETVEETTEPEGPQTLNINQMGEVRPEDEPQIDDVAAEEKAPKLSGVDDRQIKMADSGPMYADGESGESSEYNEFWTEEDEREYQRQKAEEENEAEQGERNDLQGETDPEFQFEVIDANEDPGGMRMPAHVWLENFKAEAKQNKTKLRDSVSDAVSYDRDKAEDLMTRILAARMAAGAKRHQSGSLNKWLSQKDMDQAVAKLKRNEHYKDFLTKFRSDDPFIVDAVFADLDQGHGGRVEDVFKKYLLELPAGELDSTDPNLAHFMPTAKDRIERLQKQAKTKALPSLEAAEIVALRNMVHAQRNKKSSLDVKIPPTGDLKSDVQTLGSDFGFRSALSDSRAVQKALADGHGGGIVEKVLERQREVEKNINNLTEEERAIGGNYGFRPEALKILKANTRGGRMEELRRQARSLEQQLASARGDKADRLAQQSKDIMAEYFIHQQACMEKGGKLPENLNQRLDETVPWGALDRRMQKYQENPEFQKMDFYPNEARKAMKNLADGKGDPVATVLDMQSKRQIQTREFKRPAPQPKPEGQGPVI